MQGKVVPLSIVFATGSFIHKVNATWGLLHACPVNDDDGRSMDDEMEMKKIDSIYRECIVWYTCKHTNLRRTGTVYKVGHPFVTLAPYLHRWPDDIDTLRFINHHNRGRRNSLCLEARYHFCRGGTL